MANLENELKEVKDLLLGITTSIKDIQLDNSEIHGQLNAVQALVSDNTSDQEEHSEELLDIDNTLHNPVHVHGAGAAANTLQFTHTHPGTTAQSLLATPDQSYSNTAGTHPPAARPKSHPALVPGVTPGHHLSDNPAYEQSLGTLASGRAAPVGQFRDSAPRSHDLQAAYRAIQDRWRHQRLEPEFVFNDSNRGLRKEDVPVQTALAQSAHILETCFRIFNTKYTESSGLPPDAANELYLSMSHHMRLLQDKQCKLLINKCYDPEFSQQYDNLMSGNVNMRQENIDAINMTQAIMQYRQPARQQYRQQQGSSNSNANNNNRFQWQRNFRQRGGSGRGRDYDPSNKVQDQ